MKKYSEQWFLWPAGVGEGSWWTERDGHRATFWVMETLCILMAVRLIHATVFVKVHPTIPLRCVHSSACKLYLNRKKKWKTTVMITLDELFWLHKQAFSMMLSPRYLSSTWSYIRVVSLMLWAALPICAPYLLSSPDPHISQQKWSAYLPLSPTSPEAPEDHGQP